MILFHKHSEDGYFKENRLVFIETPSPEPEAPKGEKAAESGDEKAAGDQSIDAQVRQLEEMLAAHDRGELPERKGPKGKVEMGPVEVTDARGTRVEEVEGGEKKPGEELPEDVRQSLASLTQMAEETLDELSANEPAVKPEGGEIDVAALDAAARRQGTDVNEKPFG